MNRFDRLPYLRAHRQTPGPSRLRPGAPRPPDGTITRPAASRAAGIAAAHSNKHPVDGPGRPAPAHRHGCDGMDDRRDTVEAPLRIMRFACPLHFIAYVNHLRAFPAILNVFQYGKCAHGRPKPASRVRDTAGSKASFPTPFPAMRRSFLAAALNTWPMLPLRAKAKRKAQPPSFRQPPAAQPTHRRRESRQRDARMR